MTVACECLFRESGVSGAVFIDRDGEHFQYIISFLRSGETSLDMLHSTVRRALLK